MTVELQPDELVVRYSELVGARFAFVRSLPGGRALEVVDTEGSGFVVKWDTDPGSKSRRREAIAVAEELGRVAGWPVPVFDLAEDGEFLFVRQTLMPGAELAHLSQATVDRVIELIDSTAGLGQGRPDNWPHRLLDTLVAAPNDSQMYVSHEPLRRHGVAGLQLINTIEAIGDRLDPEAVDMADDLMHWDLHPGNVLIDRGVVSAIIDLDNASAGPRHFDLITFALSARTLPGDAGVHERLMDLARARVSEAMWIASVAHLVLRFANWGIRTGHAEEAEFWIAEGQRRLAS